MTDSTPKRPTLFGLVLRLLPWMIFPSALVFVLLRGPPSVEYRVEEPASVDLFSVAVIFAMTFCLYGLALATDVLIFDYSRPVWPRMRPRLMLVNIAVMVGLCFSIGKIASMVFGPMLARLGLGGPLPNVIPVLGVAMLYSIGIVFVGYFEPITRSCISKRMQAHGVTKERIAEGHLIGISDADLSSGGKSHIEDDLGCLWIGPDFISYLGDSDRFDIARDQIISIARASNPDSMSDRSGVLPLLLRFHPVPGQTRSLRIQSEGVMTWLARREFYDRLEARIADWRVRTS